MTVIRGRNRQDVRHTFERHFLTAVAIILLVLLERNQILDRASFGARAAGRHHIGVVDQVESAEIREAHDLIMRARDNQLIAGIFIPELAGITSHSAAMLRLVVRKVLTLDVTVAAKRNDDILSRNQIEFIKIRIAGRIDLRAAGIAILFLDVEKVISDDLHHTLILRENVEVVGNLGAEFLIGGNDAFLLRRGESLETHIENAFSLHAGEPVEAIRAEAAVRFHILRPVVAVVARHGTDHLVHDLRVPALAHQAVTGLGAVRGRLDDFDELINVRQRDGKTFLQMAVRTGLTKQETGPAHNHFAAQADKGIHELLQIQQLRAAVKQRHHIDTKGRLELGQLEEVIADRFRMRVAPELDHDTDFL